jgi:hypothetical protein
LVCSKTSDGKQYNARIKGVLKIEGITSTNPIAVGDDVEMEMENELESTTTITKISIGKIMLLVNRLTININTIL